MARRKPLHSDGKHSDGKIVLPRARSAPPNNIYIAGKTPPRPSGGYVTDPQNENMRGIGKFNTAILRTTIRTKPGNNLWEIGQSEGARRASYKRFEYNTARLPPPQFIGYAPLQTAAYDDMDEEGNPVNKQGRPARGAQFTFDVDRLQHFKNQKEIFVNPTYKDYYDKVGNDPDSRDRVDPVAYKPISTSDFQKYRDVAAGINQWAQDASVYFGKKITIGKTPNVIPKNQRNTLNLEVAGYIDRGYPYATSGYVSPSAYKYPDKQNNTSSRINFNTALNDEFDAGPTANAYTMMHEFGHVLGMEHPFQYKGGTTTQSVMSYDTDRSSGSRLYPADINAYRNLMGYNKQYEAAKTVAAKNKSINKKTNRR